MLRNQSSFIENGYAWYPPFKLEKQETENQMVYNFEVANDNSYIVENIIGHNCQGFSNGDHSLTRCQTHPFGSTGGGTHRFFSSEEATHPILQHKGGQLKMLQSDWPDSADSKGFLHI